MASAAAAIDQAATPKVLDESLWWDSFVDILEELETSPLSSEIPASLSKKVLNNHKWLLDSTSLYKPPSKASRLALDSSNISVGHHRMSIKADLKEAALVASSKLCLDEVQSYILAERCLTVWKSFSNFKNGEIVGMIMAQYYLERQCLLKITRWIFAHALYTVNELQGADIIQDEAFQLMKEGLEENLLSAFESLLTVSFSDNRELETAIQHIEGTLIEENLMLDILFLVYYDNFSSCSSKQWRKLCEIFKGLLCNWFNIGKLAVSDEARCLYDHLKVRLVIVLIEAMNLEGLLRSLYDEIPSRQGCLSFSASDILEMEATISSLTTFESVEAGPLVLGWAIFVCLSQSLPDRHDSSMLMEIDHIVYVRHAFEAALDYISNVVRCNLMESDSPVSGFLSVLRTFVSSFIAAYEITFQLGESTVNIILDILSEIYRREETLCVQFWDKESFVDGPIRSLLNLLESEFPFRSAQFIKFLSSLCGGAWSAHCVYSFLENLSGISSLYHLPGNANTLNVDDVIVAPQSVPIPGLEGLTVPSNTRGQVLKVIGANSYLVRWQNAHSGMSLLLLRLAQDTHSISPEEKFHIIDLFYRMVSFNTALCFTLLEKSMYVPSNMEYKQIGKEMRINPVKVLCNFVHNLMSDSDNATLVSMCINIFSEMLKCSPSKVLDTTMKADFLGLDNLIPLSGVWQLSDGLTRMLVADGSESSGVHSLIVAVLEYTSSLLAAGSEGGAVSGLLVYSLQYVLVNHENWNYSSKYSRWNITHKIFLLVKECYKQLKYSTKLSATIRNVLLGDSSVYNRIFQVFSLMSQTLERLYSCRLIELREAECLQLCVRSALDTLFSIFSELMKLEDVGADAQLLIQILLASKTKPVSVFEAAVSLLSYSHDVDMRVAACKVLTKLCDIAVRTKHYTTGVFPSVADEKQLEKFITSVDAILADSDSSEVLVVSLFDLLVSASRYQSALLFSMVSTDDSSERRKLNLVDTMLKYLAKSENLIESAPRLLLAVLNFVKVFWEGESQYMQILDLVRSRRTFWEDLASVVSTTKLSNCSDMESVKFDLITQSTDRLRCQATALEIMSNDIFLLYKVPIQVSEKQVLSSNGNTHNFSEVLNGAMDIVSLWCESASVEGLLNLYSSWDHIDEIVRRAKIALTTCLVHLMVKLSSGDAGSLSLSLVTKINSLSKELFEQPAFSAMLAQYALCGYSKEGKFHDLVLNDLYYHLDGELRGREIVPGPFKELEAYLLQLDLFQKEPEHYNKGSKNEKNVFVFDLDHLQTELGLELWEHSTWKASKKIADEALDHMHDANLIILLSESKLSALHAFKSVLYIYNTNMLTRTPTIIARNFSPEVLMSCIGKLCQCLGDSEETLLLNLRPSQISIEHYVSKIDLLLNLCRSLFGCASVRTNWKLLLPTSVLVIRTSCHSLKLSKENRFLSDMHNKATNFVLLLLAISLEFIYPLCQIPEMPSIEADLLSEASCISLRSIPALCKYVESSEFCSTSVACLELILKGLLSPKEWLPVLKLNLNLQCLMHKVQAKDATDTARVVLRFLLTVSQTMGGAKLLQSVNLFSYLKVIFNLLIHDTAFCSASDNKATKTDAILESTLGLGLAIVTSMILAMDDDDSCIELVDSALSYFFVENPYLTYHCLSASSFSFDDLSKKRLRTQRKALSLSSLTITELTIMLFCALSKHDAIWAKSMKEKDSELREECIHMLAFISKGTHYFGESTRGISLLVSSPLHKDIEYNRVPPSLGCKEGWFGLISHSISNSKLPISSNTLALVTKDWTDENLNHPHWKYSDLAAVRIYKIAYLLLNFLCIQANKAAKRAEELGYLDLVHFPELPMPDILHGIQDQCIAIVNEVCIGNKSNAIPDHVESTCLMLLRVLEKSLYLEFCVSQSCGIRPVHGRMEDFAKELKQLMHSPAEYPCFNGLFKSLRQIVHLVYPGLLLQTNQKL